MMPPLITVGSRLPASRSAATIDVVVVLPCVPPIATQPRNRINSASISAAAHHRTAAFARRGEFQVITLDRAMKRRPRRRPRISALPADRDGDALVAQPL